MRPIPSLPHKYRVTAPMRSPRYFHRRIDAHDYARHIPGAVTHTREVFTNGSTGPWQELEVKQ